MLDSSYVTITAYIDPLYLFTLLQALYKIHAKVEVDQRLIIDLCLNLRNQPQSNDVQVNIDSDMYLRLLATLQGFDITKLKYETDKSV